MATLHTHTDDECCGPRLDTAIFDGYMDGCPSWLCPACGCEWRPVTVDIVKHWEPRPYVAVIK
jgi:hypothetical protein